MSGAWDIQLDTYNLMLDTADGKGYNGAFSFQDVSPSWVQFAQGEAGYADVQPFAEQVASNWSGSIGLYEQTDAPGDNSRCYISDCNTTVPHSLTAWQRFPGDTVPLPAGTTTTATSAVDGPTGQGAVVSATGGYGLLRWNPATHAFDLASTATVATDGTPLTFPIPSTVTARVDMSSAAAGSGEIRCPQTGASVWVPAIHASPAFNGAYDALAPLTAMANLGAVTLGFCPIADIVLGVGVSTTTMSLTVTAYDVYSGSLSVKQKKEWNGGPANISVAVPNEFCLLGMCSCEGLVYFTTDRAVYTIYWQDDTERIVVNKLIDAPLQAITSGPVNHLGEVYFGMGNSVAKITPGQRGYLPIPCDADGYMPSPYSAEVCRVYSIGQCLYATTFDAATGAEAVLRLDSKNAWSCFRLLPTNYTVNRGAPLVFDRQSGYSIAAICAPDNGAAWRPLPIFDGTRNPYAYPVALRQQVGGSHFTVQPWQYGTNRISPKHLIMVNGEVRDVSAANPIRLWVQYDDDDQKADAFVGATPSVLASQRSPAIGQGQWTLLQQFDNGAASLAAGLVAYTTNGTAVARGNIWTSLIAANLAQHTRWRFAIEIVGDTTGNTMPTFQAKKWRWLEYPAKYRIYSLRVKVAAKNLFAPSTGPQTEADVQAIVNGIYTIASTKRLVNAVLPDGVTHQVIVSKVSFQAVEGNNNGTVGAETTLPRVREWQGTLSLQEIIPLGGGGG